MLVDDIKKAALLAAKENDTVKKDVLRVALGEIQTAEARANRKLSDDEAAAVLRKLIKSNEETLAISENAAQKTALTVEIAALKAFLPASLSVEQIARELAGIADAIRAAANDGQAMGVAMKSIKERKLVAESADIKNAVKQIRGA